MNNIYEFLDGYLPSVRDPVVAEVGSHVGGDTAYLLSKMNGGRYYAFEPNPGVAALFRKNVNDYRVVFEQAAVGAAAGRMPFYPSCPPYDASSSLRKPKAHLDVSPHITFDPAVEVEVVTLDSRLRGERHVHFLWCDAQGGEGDVVRGAAGSLAKIDYMFMEWSEMELYEGQALYPQLVEAVAEHFVVLKKFDEGVPARKPDGDVLFKNRRLP